MAIGETSYVLYLSHPCVLGPLLRLSRPVIRSVCYRRLLMSISLALVTIVAILLHKVVELSASRAAHNLLSTTRLQPQPAYSAIKLQ
jgi:peptidoglycan/LPS O-acetylase OafA/YrhL